MAHTNNNLLDKAALGKRLLEMRKSNGYKKQQVADGIGMHVNNYTKCEDGTSDMSLINRDRAAAFYNVPLDYFVYEDYDLDISEERILNPEFVKKLPESLQTLAKDIEAVIKKNLR